MAAKKASKKTTASTSKKKTSRAYRGSAGTSIIISDLSETPGMEGLSDALGLNAPFVRHGVSPFVREDTSYHAGTASYIYQNFSAEINAALAYRSQNELIQSIIETKLDFIMSGFEIHCKQEKSRTYYQGLTQDHDLDKIADEIADDYETTDNAVLHWKIGKDGELDYVMTLNPSKVKYVNILGRESLTLILDDQFKMMLLDMPEEKKKNIPRKYLDAQLGEVTLREEDGEYWQVLTSARKFSGLARPSMTAIFTDIQLRQNLIAGDWAAAFFAKAFIQIVTAGEAIPSGPLAGSRKNYLKPKDRKILNEFFKNNSKAMRIVGDHTLKIDQVVPSKEAFNKEKYVPVETRIFRWGGVSIVIIEGTGGKYASGHIGKTKLIADVRRTRRKVGSFLEAFYRHPTIKKKHNESPVVWFNEQVLKDPSQLLEELRFLITEATGFSMRSTLEELGYRPETEWDRKKWDIANTDLLKPIWESKQGLLSEEEGETSPGSPTKKKSAKKAKKVVGRPKTGKVVSPSDKKQPRPSTE